MKGNTTQLTKLIGYIAKILLPVFLGSLIFSSIVAKYNNEMNLNKSIIESAYQPMKRQFRICTEDKTKLLNTLNHLKALINGIKEGLLQIDKGIGPPQIFIGDINKSAAHAGAEAIEIEELKGNLMMSYFSLGNLFEDLEVMLAVKKEQNFLKIINTRHEQFRLFEIKSEQILKEQLGRLELVGVLAMLEKALANDLSDNSERSGLIEFCGKVSRIVQSLIHLENEEFNDQVKDYRIINDLTIEELRNRYQKNIFDYLIDLF